MATAQHTPAKRSKPGDEEGSGKQRAVRRRATVACEECRIRKRRCDGASPVCEACMKRMTRCMYASDNETREWRSNLIQSLRNQLDELEKEEPHAPSAANEFNRSAEERSTGFQHHSPRPPASSAANYPVTINDAAHEPTEVTQGRMSGDLANSQCAYSPEVLETCNVEKMMKPISRMIDKRTPQNERPNTSPTHNVASPTRKSLEDRQTAACKCISLLNTQRQWCLPPRRRADSLVARYFARNNIPFPILHEGTFRRQYALLWDSDTDQRRMQSAACVGLCKQKSQGQLFFPTVYALFTIASLFETNNPEQNGKVAEGFFRMAQEVNFLEILDNRVGMELVQLLLLMGRYLQSTERLSKFKNISRLAIHMAQNVGLHYDVEEARQRGLLSAPVTQLECEMRARVWYGCVLLERDIPEYLPIGRPLFSAINRRVTLPQAIDDDRLSDEVGRIGAQPEGSPSLLEPYIQIIKICNILGQVEDREESNSDNVSDEASSIQLLLRLDAALIEWRDCLPPYLQYSGTSDGTAWTETPGLTKDLDRYTSLQKQAKKLYLRYLNARQLILRPALELYFQKQQSTHPTPSLRNRDTGLADVMLSRIAAECVMSAMSVVELLVARRETNDYMAWWLNVSFLHTCGSNLLMARMCIFTEARFTNEFLTSRWNMCLKGLERYTGLSSIARKSLYLLRHSAKRLISPSRAPAYAGRPFGQDTGDMATQQGSDSNHHQLPPGHETWSPGAYNLPGGVQLMRPLTENPMDRNGPMVDFSRSTGAVDPIMEPEPRFGDLFDLDDGFWSSTMGRQTWPPIPSSLPQLENLSPPFDF